MGLKNISYRSCLWAYWLLMLFLSAACSSKTSDSAASVEQRVTVKSEKIVTKRSPKTAGTTNTTQSASTILKQQLFGVWTDGSTENAVFDISEHSIYYTEQFEAYPYLLSNDSITISFPDDEYRAKVIIKADTLVMVSTESGKSTFWRFKK